MARNQDSKEGEGTVSVDAMIKAALSVFGDPVANTGYYGDAERYYVFNYTTTGADFADDEPEHERYLVQVHLFAPLDENIVQRKKQTKKVLQDAGFTWPETHNASEGDGQHIVFECEIAEGVG